MSPFQTRTQRFPASSSSGHCSLRKTIMLVGDMVNKSKVRVQVMHLVLEKYFIYISLQASIRAAASNKHRNRWTKNRKNSFSSKQQYFHMFSLDARGCSHDTKTENGTSERTKTARKKPSATCGFFSSFLCTRSFFLSFFFVRPHHPSSCM